MIAIITIFFTVIDLKPSHHILGKTLNNLPFKTGWPNGSAPNGFTLSDGARTINILRNEQGPRSISENFLAAILEDFAHQIWVAMNPELIVKIETTIHFRIMLLAQKTYLTMMTFVTPVDCNWI